MSSISNLYILNRLIPLCFLICYLASCSQDARQHVNTYQVSFDQINELPLATPINNLIIEPADSDILCYVVNGVICKISTKKRDRQMSIELFDTVKSKHISYNFHDEYLIHPIATRSWNKIVIHDGLIGKTIVVDVENAFKQDSYSPLKKFSNIQSERLIYMGDKMLFLNKDSFENGTPRVCFSDDNWNYSQKNRYRYDSGNVVHGEIICKEDLSRIVYIPGHDNQIEIMDGNGDLLTKVVFPHNKKQEITTFESNNKLHYVFSFPPVYCFSSACAGKSGFIAGFIDDNDNHLVLMMDWAGKFLGGFRIDGEIQKLSFSSDERMIYSWTKKNEECYLEEYINPCL